MRLLVVSWESGDRTVHLPKGEPEPIIVHPEVWVGQDSPHAMRGFAVQIGGPLGGDVGLFVANGNKPWYQEGYGTELLRLLKPVQGWEFAEAFLQFWLSYVFGQEVTLEYVTHTS